MKLLDENKEFNQAVAFVNQTGRNLFLTGKAGTGKTTFLKHICQHCYKNMAILAPTGVAAINAGGVTIHSFFQLPFGIYIPDAVTEWGNPENSTIFNKSRLLSKLKFNRNKLELIRELDMLIIDEISMVRADLLDAVDDVLRAVRCKPDVPFGGIQMIFIGDLFQLPPVVKNEELSLLKSYYDSPFFFDSRAIKAAPPVFIELKKIYRQNDENFIALLNKVRNNQCIASDIEQLNHYYQPDFEPGFEEEYITLTSHNFIADKINQGELENLPGKKYVFEAQVNGDFPERAYPADKALELKKGAQIMFIKNDTGEARRFFNGKIGKIETITSDRKIMIRFQDEENLFEIPTEKWSNIKYNYNNAKDSIEEEELGTFEQLPIRLAWAVTIHKSQGLTFDRAIIDAGKSFAAGQVYVALSRLRGLNGLVLRSQIYPSSISTDTTVLNYTRAQAETELHQESLLEEEQKAFIGQSLIKAFDWDKLLEKAFQFMKDFDERKIEDKERFVVRSRKIFEQIQSTTQTAAKFKHQLEMILPDAPDNNFEQLNERTKAATEWFCKQLESNIINPFKELQQQAKVKKRTSKFQKEIQLITLDFERKKQRLQQIVALANGLHQKMALPELMAQISDMQKPKEAPLPIINKAPKGETRTITLEMYKAGKSIQQIAQERALQQSTIETHLIQYIPSGEVDISIFIQEKEAKRIVAFLENHDTEISSNEIKTAFEDEFSYTQIRAVRSWYSALQQKN